MTSAMKNREKKKKKKLSDGTQSSSNSVRECSDLVPIDLLIDIFSRVPAKSVARFRCVSKLWSSVLGRTDFTELFRTKSRTRPRLLFVFKVNNDLFLFSSPQPGNPDGNLSLVATPYRSFPQGFSALVSVCPPLCGLVCLQNWRGTVVVIYNPATGESITLPEPKANSSGRSFSGYDPVDKQFKVLCMTWSVSGTQINTQVLTLGTGELLWRMINPIVPHFPIGSEVVCINGVLYYKAFQMVVCFDVRSERFSFVNLPNDELYGRHPMNLVNYKGKLGVCHRYIIESEDLFTIWVLEDDEWSKKQILLTPLWDMTKEDALCVVGVTVAGEIVFASGRLPNPLDIFFCSLENESFTRVKIHGMEKFTGPYTLMYTFLDHVENLTLT